MANRCDSGCVGWRDLCGRSCKEMVSSAKAEIVRKLREQVDELCAKARMSEGEDRRAYNIKAAIYQEASDWIEAGCP